VELAEILVLETGEGVPRIEPLDGIHALQAVAINTYRPEYIALLGRHDEHFRQCGCNTPSKVRCETFFSATAMLAMGFSLVLFRMSNSFESKSAIVLDTSSANISLGAVSRHLTASVIADTVKSPSHNCQI
jgi:hypothetical protein